MKSTGTNSISDESSVFISPLSESDISIDSPTSVLSRSYSFEEVTPIPAVVFLKVPSHVNAVPHFHSSLIQPAYFSEIGETSFNESDRALIADCEKGLEFNQKPVELQTGVTGAFLMKRFGGGYAAIFKPEETLTRRSSMYISKPENSARGGILHSDSSVREVAAFILDKNEGNFIGVPQTLMVKINSKFFKFNAFNTVRGPKISQRSLSIQSTPSFLKEENMSLSGGVTAESDVEKVTQVWKIGSLQKFINHDLDAFDISASKFSTNQIHKIGVFDVRTLNSDRHEGNLLVKLSQKNDFNSDLTLIPIDHGQILPDFNDFNIEGNFCWMNMKQSKEKFNEEVKEHIRGLDPFQERKNLVYMLGSRLTLAGLFSLILGTILLKICVLEFDMSLYEVGYILTGQGENEVKINGKRSSVFVEIIAQLTEEDNDLVDWEIIKLPVSEISSEIKTTCERKGLEKKYLSRFTNLLRSRISKSLKVLRELEK